MSFILLTVLAPLSFVIGIGASAIGVTAWMMLVPIMFVFFGIDLYLTLFISLLIDCGNALIMTVFANQNKQMSLKLGLMLSFFASIFVVVGIYVGTTFIPENKNLFKAPTIFMNFLFGLGFIRRGYKQGKLAAGDSPAEGDPLKSVSVAGDRKPFMRTLFIYPAVFLVGFQSGLFGIGGGMLYSIFLMLFLVFPTLKATGTAMLITLVTTMIAATGIFFQIPIESGIGRQEVILILTMVLFSMVGTILGARIAYSLSLKKLNYLIATVIISASLIAFVQSLLINS